MDFGPHTPHVAALFEALTDPAVRRSRRCRLYDIEPRPLVANAVYNSVVAASRLETWDAARMGAAELAVPSQRNHAASAALAIVASDLLDDAAWRYYTDTPLAHLVSLERPGGPLAERCRCGVQIGQWLAATKVRSFPPPRALVGCAHTTPSLPTPEAVEIAWGLAATWDGADWVALVESSRSLAVDAGGDPAAAGVTG